MLEGGKSLQRRARGFIVLVILVMFLANDGILAYMCLLANSWYRVSPFDISLVVNPSGRIEAFGDCHKPPFDVSGDNRYAVSHPALREFSQRGSVDDSWRSAAIQVAFDFVNVPLTFMNETCVWTKKVLQGKSLSGATAIVCDELLRLVLFGSTSLCDDFLKINEAFTQAAAIHRLLLCISLISSFTLIVWIAAVPIMNVWRYTVLLKTLTFAATIWTCSAHFYSETFTSLQRTPKALQVLQTDRHSILFIGVSVVVQSVAIIALLRLTRPYHCVDHPDFIKHILVDNPPPRELIVDRHLSGGPWEDVKDLNSHPLVQDSLQGRSIGPMT